MSETYGVDNYFKRVDLVQEHMMKKHGVKNPGLMEDHVSKMVSTNKEKYGVKWAAFAPEVAQRRKDTNIEKYGSDALRLFLVGSPVVRGEPLKFKESEVLLYVNKLYQY